MSSSGLSIIIPAHNETAVIERTLRSILNCKLSCPRQIIVVANGCDDDTAAIARSVSPEIQVIESTVGSKIIALNLGDREARYFPRAYLDADIQLSENALQGVVDMFANDPQCRICGPTPQHQYHGWNPFLAGYYWLWRSMPYVKNAIMGGGFYAIDEQTRGRFLEFPNVVADDKYIRNMTKPEERRVIRGAYASVSMPASFAALVKVKTRWTYGNMELAAKFPHLTESDADHREGALGFVLLRPWHWPSVPAFLIVKWLSARAAKKRFAKQSGGWDRDHSTRNPLPQPRSAA